MTTTTNPATDKARAASSAQTLRLLRQLHLYFGLFITPALLFFAFTGAVQTLSLHEAAGTSYKPPNALAVWAQIHKNQTWQLPARRLPPPRQNQPGANANAGAAAEPGEPASPAASPGGGAGASQKSQGAGPKVSAAPSPTASTPAASRKPETLSAKQKQHLPLKLFFLLVSLGLFSSTLTGIYMAYKYNRNKLLVTGLLLAGAIVPLALLPF